MKLKSIRQFNRDLSTTEQITEMKLRATIVRSCLIAIKHSLALAFFLFYLDQYVKTMSCLRAGLPKAWQTTSEPRKTDHRVSAKQL